MDGSPRTVFKEQRIAARLIAWVLALSALAVMPAAVADARIENIRDGEVREIQRALAKILPGELISIGPVIEGCACEEEGLCTNEVRVGVQPAASTPQFIRMVLVDKAWHVSRLSRWQIETAKLDAGFRQAIAKAADANKRALRLEYERKLAEARRDKPRCTAMDRGLAAPPPALPPRP